MDNRLPDPTAVAAPETSAPVDPLPPGPPPDATPEGPAAAGPPPPANPADVAAEPPAPAVPPVPLPSFNQCLEVVPAGGRTGIEALATLAEPLEQDCPALATVLRSAAVRTVLETYARQNAEAVRQQDSLKREATLANVCIMATGVTSGLVLVVAALLPSDYVGPVTLALGIVALALGATATYFGFLARDQGRVSRWQARRGEAEVARLAVFTTIAGKAADAGPPVALYGLAVVVRHLLNDQRTWMGKSTLRHRKSSETTSRLGGLGSALAFIGGSGAVIASQSTGSLWVVLAGLIGAAVSSFALNRDALRRDRANADRYEKVQVALDGLAERVDDVANRIAAGEPKALVAFTDTVTDLLAAEYKQWQEGTAQAEASLVKLDAQLKQLAEAKK
jgi:hypothetical protein